MGLIVLFVFYLGEFEIVTILFSDIVSFTNICAECRPIDIVNMLNSLYTRFDMLTSVHDVYKVWELLIILHFVRFENVTLKNLKMNIDISVKV